MKYCALAIQLFKIFEMKITEQNWLQKTFDSFKIIAFLFISQTAYVVFYAGLGGMYSRPLNIEAILMNRS